MPWRVRLTEGFGLAVQWGAAAVRLVTVAGECEALASGRTAEVATELWRLRTGSSLATWPRRGFFFGPSALQATLGMRVLGTHAAEMESASAGRGRQELTARRSTLARSAKQDKPKTVRASTSVLKRVVHTAVPKRYGAVLCMNAEAERSS